MAKPVTKVRWADTTAVNITEPISGLKDVGWLTNAIPTAQNFNWLFNEVMLWQNYLDGLTGEVLAWTAAHSFAAAVTFALGITVTSATASSAVTGKGTDAGSTGATGYYDTTTSGTSSNGIGVKGVYGTLAAFPSGLKSAVVGYTKFAAALAGYFTAADVASGNGIDVFKAVGGLTTAASGIGGKAGLFIGGIGKGASGIGGRGHESFGGDFVPTVTSDNGTSGIGALSQAGNVKTDGTASTTGYAHITRGGSLRDAADANYQKGTLRAAKYVTPGVKLNNAGSQIVQGTGIRIVDESSGAALGGPNEASWGIDMDPELASVRVQRGASWGSAANDMRDTLCWFNTPAVACRIQLSATTPTILGSSIGVHDVSYFSANRLRITFGRSGLAYQMADNNYVAVLGSGRYGTVGATWSEFFRDASFGYVDYVLFNTTSGSLVTIDDGSSAPSAYLNLVILGTWA